MLLSRFHSTRPRFEITQEASLAWLAAAHAEAEASTRGFDDLAKAKFTTQIARLLRRVACQPEKIRTRGHSVADIGNDCWNDGELYDVRRHPRGRGAAARVALFSQIADAYFEAEYSAEHACPDDLIHVSCTGYASPNAAQKLVARRGWGGTTRVTSAYQMGCYAAIPAIRIGCGFVATASRRVDVVHTELCSLHFQPANHELDQLVVQSLFGDGLIRYAIEPDRGAPGLRVVGIHEQILADSAHAMTWIGGDKGMEMTLSRDVPDRIAKGVRQFVIELFGRAGRGVGDLRHAVCAVHPGGPKIIDQVQRVLELEDAQLAESRRVLLDFGNMSSATLPHVWMRVLDDPAVPVGTLVPSLAFGPGLTMCGVLLEKR